MKNRMDANNWQIDSENALLSFRIEPVGSTDLRLILARRTPDTVVASMNYSGFTPFSQSRPWDLKTPVFRKISVEQTFHGLQVEAETEFFRIRDFFIWEDRLLKIARSWELLKDMENLVLGTRLPLKRHEQEKWTIPGVIYNDNPSADPEKLVPHLPRQESGVLAVEEHRLPIPGINAEWKNEDGSFSGFTLFSVPSETPMKEYWSMGLQRTQEGFDLLSLSGAAAFDEKKDCIYGAQNKMYHIPDFGYMDLKQGTVLRKTLFIHFQKGFQEGRGFAALVEQGMKINDPQAHPVLSLEQMIELKTCSLISHWKETEHGSGFSWILEGKENGNVYNAKPGFLYGWVGQSLRLAWCAFQLAFSGKKEWFERGIAVLDHFASAPEAGNIPGLKYLFQDHETGEWFTCELRTADGIYSRMMGESLANLADTLLLLKKHGTEIQEKWENALRRGIAFLREPGHRTDTGIFPLSFRLDGTPASQIVTGSGTSCIEAVIRAGEYFEDPEMLDSGFEMLDRYYELFLKTLRQPFSRATLDAACEDKESGLYFFLASYRAYCLTKSAKYEKYAEESALWISTFVYQWNTVMKAGSICADHGFESVFWPSVSVQNMHLDVFFPAWEFYDFGKRAGKDIFCRIGQGVMQAWSYGIARFPGDWNYALPGEQGEQFYHTNYYQGYFDERAWRGGANAWNPVWITALVLYAALHFKKTPMVSRQDPAIDGPDGRNGPDGQMRATQ